MSNEQEPITEDWLREVGFKWHQLERQPEKHWLLWLGDAVREADGGLTSYEDIGVELTTCGYRNHKDEMVNDDGRWFCWLRADTSGRYHRFIHMRHLRYQGELIVLIEAISGHRFDPANNFYGSMCGPKRAELNRRDSDRLDRRVLAGNAKWSDIERDDSRGRALPEHMEAAVKAGKAK